MKNKIIVLTSLKEVDTPEVKWNEKIML